MALIDSWPDLVDRLASHDVRYLIGGSQEYGGDSAYAGRENPPLTSLFRDLARAPQARLRSAIIALLLRHPEYAEVAESSARSLGFDDPAGRLLLLSLVVAAALQAKWKFSLDIYLPQQTTIQSDHLTDQMDLPRSGGENGKACLAAVAVRQRENSPFPFAYEAEWDGIVRRLLSQLRRERRP